MSTAVVCDSCCDIAPELAQSLGIEVIPDLITIGGRSYTEGVELPRETFYDQLPTYNPPPQTAAPAMGVFLAAYERLYERGARTILSIHPSPHLSALHSIAQKAAEAARATVHVVDGANVTLSLGYQAIAAAKALRAGASLDDAMRAIASVRRRVRLYAMLDTLEYVRRSGRVGWVTATLGSLLGVRALIELKEGVVLRGGLARSRKQAVAQLIQRLCRLGALEALTILHTTLADPVELRQVLQAAPDTPQPPDVQVLTPIIGAHVGPRCLGFVALLREES